MHIKHLYINPLIFFCPHPLQFVPLCVENRDYHFYKSLNMILIGLVNLVLHIGHVTGACESYLCFVHTLKHFVCILL